MTRRTTRFVNNANSSVCHLYICCFETKKKNVYSFKIWIGYASCVVIEHKCMVCVYIYTMGLRAWPSVKGTLNPCSSINAWNMSPYLFGPSCDVFCSLAVVPVWFYFAYDLWNPSCWKWSSHILRVCFCQVAALSRFSIQILCDYSHPFTTYPNNPTTALSKDSGRCGARVTDDKKFTTVLRYGTNLETVRTLLRKISETFMLFQENYLPFWDPRRPCTIPIYASMTPSYRLFT